MISIIGELSNIERSSHEGSISILADSDQKQTEANYRDVKTPPGNRNDEPRIPLASVAETPKVASLPSSQHDDTAVKYFRDPPQETELNVFSRFCLDSLAGDCRDARQYPFGKTDYGNETANNKSYFDKKSSRRAGSAARTFRKETFDLQVSVVSSSSLNAESSEILPPTLPEIGNDPPLWRNGNEPSVHSKLSVNTAENQIQCTICARILANPRNLRAHMNTHNDGVRYSCPTCGKSYAWKYSLTLHMRSSHCSASISAPKIPGGKRGASVINETVNAGDLHGTESFKKRDGDGEGLQIARFKKLAQKGLQSETAVPMRDKSSESRSSRSKTEAKASSMSADENSDGFMYPCIDCSQPFKTEDQMWNHFEATHCTMDQVEIASQVAKPSSSGFVDRTSNSRQCNICGKVFSTSAVAMNHEASHTGEKNFSCDVCQRKFVWNGSLRKHLQRTSCGKGKKEIQIRKAADSSPVADAIKEGIKEQESFSFVSSTKDKQRGVVKSHLPAPLECDTKIVKDRKKAAKSRRVVPINKHAVLAENFIRKTILLHEGYGIKKEMAGFVDLGDGPEIGNHTCKVCDNTYKYKSSLKIHMRNHTGELPYQCGICKERFAAHRYCRKHVIRHGKESEDQELRIAFQNLAHSGKGDSSRDNKTEQNDIARSHDQGPSPRKSTNKQVISVDESGESPTDERGTARERGMPKRKAKSKALSYVALIETSDDELSVNRKRRTRKKIVRDSLHLKKISNSETSSEEEEISPKRRLVDRRTSSSHSSFLSNKEDSDEEWPGGSFMDDEEAEFLSDDVSDESLIETNDKSPPTKIKTEGHLGREKPRKNDGKPSRLLFQCKVCDTKFASRFVLRRHEVITGHAKASYECPYCKRIYSEGGAYSNHMYVHQRKNGMKCDICGKELQSRTTFLNHKEMHKKNPFTCKLCFEWFPSEKKLEEHTNTSHDTQKEFKCKYCLKTFDWQSNYTRHLNKHTNKKEFKCKICHYSFNIISNLKRHMVSVHKGETEFGANTWEAVNPVQVDHVLNRQHQRRDLWKVEEDTEDEEKGIKRRGRLKALKAVNRKKYPCEICSFLCSSRMELTNHLRYGHKKQNNPESALIHFIIEDENFICQLCGSVIYIRHSLKNHMLRVHQLDISEDNIAGVSKFGNDVKVEGRVKQTSKQKPKPSPAENDSRRSGEVDQLHGAGVVSSSNGDKEVRYLRQRKKQGLSAESGKTSLPDKCSLCANAFACKEQLIEHLRDFHKIPAGFEEALIEMTKDVNNPKTGQSQSNSDERDKAARLQKKENDSTLSSERRNNESSQVQECPICNQRFESVALLARHAAICDQFTA